MSSSAEPGVPRDNAQRTLAQHVFDEWPPPLRALFDGTALAAKVGFTASLITCDAGGPLRTSLLGIGELYAPDSRCLAFALWPTSRAARTLASDAPRAEHVARAGPPITHAIAPNDDHRRVRAALTFVHDGAFHQVQVLVEAMGRTEAGDGLEQFIAWIDAGEVQQVGYACLTSGIRFELSGTSAAQEAVLARWQRQIDRLRQAAHERLAAGRETVDC